LCHLIKNTKTINTEWPNKMLKIHKTKTIKKKQWIKIIKLKQRANSVRNSKPKTIKNRIRKKLNKSKTSLHLTLRFDPYSYCSINTVLCDDYFCCLFLFGLVVESVNVDDLFLFLYRCWCWNWRTMKRQKTMKRLMKREWIYVDEWVYFWWSGSIRVSTIDGHIFFRCVSISSISTPNHINVYVPVYEDWSKHQVALPEPSTFEHPLNAMYRPDDGIIAYIWRLSTLWLDPEEWSLSFSAFDSNDRWDSECW